MAHPTCVHVESSNGVNDRRSANYQPTSWDYHSLQTLPSTYQKKENSPFVEELMEEVRRQMDGPIGLVRQLELIEAIDRIGLASLFLQEIFSVLSLLSCNGCEKVIPYGLRSTAICFRLLRRFGFQVSEGIFSGFMNGDRSFRESLSEDVLELLSLYHASDMGFDDEQIMEEAKAFSSKHIRGKIGVSCRHKRDVAHALDLPLHWRMPWMEARMYIDMYGQEDGMSPALHLLAKLHFNEVQSIHQMELKQALSWWTRLDLGKTIRFSRNRLMECFFYVVGIVHDPDYGICREELTKVGMLVATIDDVYDVYGSLEELELFSQIVDSWDMKGIKQLPDYMKVCFLALNDTINEVTNHLSHGHRLEAKPYMQRVWADLCKAFLVEAKWHSKGYMPTLKEYLSIASISATGHVILLHVYILLKCKITKVMMQLLLDFPNIIRLPSLIFRLCNDLATSTVEQERGDTPTSIQCFMNETGASEEEARKHISILISNAWKEMNRECSSNQTFPRRFIDASINLARMASFMYRHGDGFSAPNHEMKSSISSLLVNSITDL